MKKKIALIILIFAAVLIVWSVYSSNKAQLISFANVEQKTAVIKNEKINEIKVIKNESNKIEGQGLDQFDQYLNALPTAEDLKNLTYDEVHHTPEIVKNAGAIIGRIHSEAQVDASKRSSAMNFFKICAEDDKVVTSIRAVCLKKIYKLIPEWKLPIILSEQKISKEVTDLSMKIP